MSATRIGFIGMGIMGAPMAANCIKAGFDVTVYNRTPSKAQILARLGAKVAQTPAELAKDKDFILICVTNTHDVLQVVLDEEVGVISQVSPSTIVIDHSTVAPHVAADCCTALNQKNATFLDAPVSGGDVGAKEGTLSIMVGGGRSAYEKSLDVLHAMGKTITYCGPSGCGYTVKLCNQILGGVHLLAAAEALTLADRAGVDTTAMLQAVSGGAAGSWVLTHLAPKMVSGDDRPGFFVDYQLKDLHLAQSLAARLKTPLPSTALAESMMLSASALGYGKSGTQAVYHALRRMIGE